KGGEQLDVIATHCVGAGRGRWVDFHHGRCVCGGHRADWRRRRGQRQSAVRCGGVGSRRRQIGTHRIRSSLPNSVSSNTDTPFIPGFRGGKRRDEADGGDQKPRVRRQPRSGPLMAPAVTSGTSARWVWAVITSVPTREPGGNVAGRLVKVT